MIVLLPVYRPSSTFGGLVAALREAATDVVVVDDGSGPSAGAVWETVERLGGTVLRHPVNRGKGVAIRTGLRYAMEHRPGEVVVTADADGQHQVADILRVGRHTEVTGRIALGVRRFTGRVPVRSRVGNTVTSALFRLATGHRLGDTQTGLRAFPPALLPWLADVPGDGFDYEMQMLLDALRCGHPLDQVDVATTYLGDNAGSHFGAVSDSLRVYRPMLRHALGTRPLRA